MSEAERTLLLTLAGIVVGVLMRDGLKGPADTLLDMMGQVMGDA